MFGTWQLDKARNWITREHVVGLVEDGHPVIYINGVKLDEGAYLNKYPIIATWKHDEYDLKSFDPAIPFNKQPFYKIDPASLIINPQTKEPYISYPGDLLPDNKDIFNIKLGSNQYWVMGDNRLGSSDSRSWGPLDGSLIHAKIAFRLWSIDSDESWWLIDLLKHPIDFWKKIRIDRCLQFV